MTNAGNIVFGNSGNTTCALTSPNTYNDSNWHYAVGVWDGTNAYLYIDGSQVASHADSAPTNYNGYWRLGFGQIAYWPNPPSSAYFGGSLSEAAAYPYALTSTQVANHYSATTGPTPTATATTTAPVTATATPTASLTATPTVTATTTPTRTATSTVTARATPTASLTATPTVTVTTTPTTTATVTVTATATATQTQIATSTPTATPFPFYVTNLVADYVTAYLSGSSGNVSPLSSGTGLVSPFGIARDASGNQYVTNQSSNTVTVYAAGANGNAAPILTIAGSNTGLNNPTGIALDGSGNVYVANAGSINGGNDTITEYAAASGGNAEPIATITGGNTALENPIGIALDSAGNIYVANDGSAVGSQDSVVIYPAGSTGNSAPSATITGTATGLEVAYGIALDSSGISTW